MRNKILYFLLIFLFSLNIIGHIFNIPIFMKLALVLRLSPYPIVFSNQHGVESYAYKAKVTLNDKSIFLNNNLAYPDCSHNQIITEVIPYFVKNNLYDKKKMYSLNNSIFCKKSCIVRTISEKINLMNPVEKYKLEITTLQGERFVYENKCF